MLRVTYVQYVIKLDCPLQGVMPTRSPALTPLRVFGLDTHILDQLDILCMLQPLSSAQLAYATAVVAGLPHTATNRVTLQTYCRSYSSFISSAQRYSIWQPNGTDDDDND